MYAQKPQAISVNSISNIVCRPVIQLNNYTLRTSLEDVWRPVLFWLMQIISRRRVWLNVQQRHRPGEIQVLINVS